LEGLKRAERFKFFTIGLSGVAKEFKGWSDCAKFTP
jgi:hypothetical protein